MKHTHAIITTDSNNWNGAQKYDLHKQKKVVICFSSSLLFTTLHTNYLIWLQNYTHCLSNRNMLSLPNFNKNEIKRALPLTFTSASFKTKNCFKLKMGASKCLRTLLFKNEWTSSVAVVIFLLEFYCFSWLIYVKKIRMLLFMVNVIYTNNDNYYLFD